VVTPQKKEVNLIDSPKSLELLEQPKSIDSDSKRQAEIDVKKNFDAQFDQSAAK